MIELVRSTGRDRVSYRYSGVTHHMTENIKKDGARQIDRRTIVKGAAWSVPAIAAATAMPLAAAATEVTPPPCPSCLKPGIGAFELGGAAVGSKALLAFVAPVILDATDCGSILGNIFDFKPAFTYIVTKATLTMSDGANYDSTIGLAPGAGVLGAVGTMPAAFAFSNVEVDSNAFRTGLPRNRPTSLTITINTTLKWGLGAEIICPNTLVYDLRSAINVSLLAAGVGVITYTGTTGIF